MSVALNCDKKIVRIDSEPHFCDYDEFMPSLNDAERFAMTAPSKPGIQWNYFKVVSYVLAALAGCAVYALGTMIYFEYFKR